MTSKRSHVDALVAQAELHFGREAEQAQEVGHSGAFLAHTFRQTLLCEVVLVDEFLEGQGYLYGVEVLALDVLDEGHLGELGLVGGADVSRHIGETCHPGCAEASLAGYDLVGVGSCLAQRQGLYDSQLAYGCGQLGECLLVEGGARLVGVGGDAVERYVVYGR